MIDVNVARRVVTSSVTLTFLAALAGAPVALGAAPAFAAEGSVEGVVCEGEVGGYSPYLQFGCNLLKVTLSDTTPSEGPDYTVMFDGRPLTPFHAIADAGRVDLLISTAGLRDDLVSGSAYPVAVSEGTGPSSPTYTYVYDQVAAPSSANPVLTQGGYEPGAKSSVQFEGQWESGSQVTTKVVGNVGGTRQEAVANSGSEIAITSAYSAATNSIEFTVPPSAAGRYIWVSVSATHGAKVTSGFQLAPVMASGDPRYDRSWVTSFGSRTGVAKVGKRIGLTAPTFSSPAAKEATTVRYRWFKNGRALSGASKSRLRLTRAMKGKRITVRQTFTADGYRSLVRRVSFGRVR